MRRSVTGDELPSARVVSAQLLTDLNKPSREISLALVFFGQFVDHDLTRTAITKIPLNDGGNCFTLFPVSSLEAKKLLVNDKYFFDLTGKRIIKIFRNKNKEIFHLSHPRVLTVHATTASLIASFVCPVVH